MVESDIKALGYVRAESAQIPRWREFALDALGFAEGTGPNEDGLYLRLDERSFRIAVLPGESDRVTEIGWEVADALGLERIQERLKEASVGFQQLTQDELDERRIVDGITFVDPTGTSVEIFHGAVLDHSPVVTPHGASFVTGAQGLGHVVVPASAPQATFDFYAKVLGFYPRGSFRLPGEPGSDVVRFQFLGVNSRHHSLAIAPAAAQRDPGLVHVMVEVTDLDTVGEAYDRVKAAGFSLTTTLGRHTNDKMVSFYVRAPGGWDIEFGTGGLQVEQSSYTSEEITADSYWGHEWVGDAPEALIP
jgi:3,4-dihydroxy-9,10-secoandrosta-1,3,5(10)-triene-9,17-dione 4,5-dioxygenase